MKKEKRINVEHHPLSTVFGLRPLAGPLLQNHNASTGEFAPDRAITPLTLAPALFVADPSGLTPGGDMTARLVDIRYYLDTETPDRLIAGGRDGFTIAPAGALTVTRNVPYMAPLTVICVAGYFDSASGRVYRFTDSVTLSSTSAIEDPVTLELDRPAAWTFDPLTEDGTRTIRATLRLAGREVADEARRRFRWMVVGPDGDERAVDPDDDLFHEAGQGTPTLTVDPRYVDTPLRLRCRAEYLPPATDGSPVASPPTALQADTVVTRRYSGYDIDFVVHGGERVDAAAPGVVAEGWAIRPDGIVPDLERRFACQWNLRRKTWGARPRTIAHGQRVTIAREDYADGADLEFELREREPLKAASDGDTVFTDQGAVLTI
ncbi:MAG: hypothetical protein LBN29_11275 [Mediterranea sp.]|jgi:hypothetical protein|nr:hypothetical protein [Mediterranea sp.]